MRAKTKCLSHVAIDRTRPQPTWLYSRAGSESPGQVAGAGRPGGFLPSGGTAAKHAPGARPEIAKLRLLKSKVVFIRDIYRVLATCRQNSPRPFSQSAAHFSAPRVPDSSMFDEYVWVVIVGSIFAFAASFGIGANDVGKNVSMQLAIFAEAWQSFTLSLNSQRMHLPHPSELRGTPTKGAKQNCPDKSLMQSHITSSCRRRRYM